MKINQNTNNHFMKKICNKTYAKNKKEESIIQNNKSEIKKNSKPINSSSFSKRSSNSTYKYVKFQETEKCNTYRESNEIKNKISQDESGIKNYKSKKKKNNVVFKNINNKNEVDNKIILNSNLMKENKKDILNNNTLNNKTIVAVCHNKTINHIRIKNRKLNSVLYNYYENQSFKNKLLNSYLPLRNYNSLNKSDNLIKTKNSSSKSIEKEKRTNKSFREKGKTDIYFESSNLKIKLKKNNSIGKGYINFYKVNKRSSKNINENRYKLNLADINNKEEYDNENIQESHNKVNTISCFNKIALNSKENESKSYNDEIKNTKKNNYDIIKMKKEKIKINMQNEPKNERENNKNMKKKSKTTYLKITSKSVGKRNIQRNSKNNNNMKFVEKKENNIVKKLSDIAEKFAINKNKYNSRISKKSKTLITLNNENNKVNELNDDIAPRKEKFIYSNKNNFTNNDIFDSDSNKKNYDIFEVISDVKVKSFIEYEEEKKNLLNKKESDNHNESKNYNSDKNEIDDFNDNLNIQELTNFQNEENAKEIEENNSSDKFIEDRDEYNVILKETFSKDRFSFKPTNRDSIDTFQESKFKNGNKILDKKDFLNDNHFNSSSSFKFNNYLENSNKDKKKNKKARSNHTGLPKVNKLKK